ncbi:MAG: hypothetical protein ACK5LN_08575 [Propioniciclava sp.]
MSRLLRLLVTGIVTSLALVSITLPARAAADPEAATSAAAWIASQADTISDVGGAADALFALAAAQDDSTTGVAGQLLAQVTSGGAAYVADSPEGAAKLTILAAAYGENPRSFIPDTDLVAMVTAGIADDGSFGAYPGPFATGLAAVALNRAGETIPENLLRHLATYTDGGGGYSFEAGGAADADSTGMALLALIAAGDTEAAAKAQAWAAANQNTEGSWDGYNPVNSTAILGSALQSATSDQPKAVEYLVSQQQESGSFLQDDAANLMATTQAVLLLGGVSYLEVSWQLSEPTSTPPVPTTTEASPAPTAPDDPASDFPVLPTVATLVALLSIVAFMGWHRRREVPGSTPDSTPTEQSRQ